MSKYDDLFDETVPGDSVFADKGAPNPFDRIDELCPAWKSSDRKRDGNEGEFFTRFRRK